MAEEGAGLAERGGRALLGSEEEMDPWRSGGRVVQPKGPASAQALRSDLLCDEAVLKSEGTSLGDWQGGCWPDHAGQAKVRSLNFS